MSTATAQTVTLNNSVEMPALGLGVFQNTARADVVAVEARESLAAAAIRRRREPKPLPASSGPASGVVT
jgi:hypothetical protein